MKLVKNANAALRMWSNQSAATAAVLALQEVVPLWEPFVPDNVFAMMSAAAATAAVFLRVIDQGLDN
ncbi:hypothetical protein MKP05_09485 [Halomonas sp. EGI 63088]|uniref:Holin n=1 Tax=Halomonas flagellata TaxID=2920385 RepID=A0ABS9RU35_9GAMM|nr:hypothetical protein [Halomonas flagellata]MCH4563361.1 hypothetical protein [Halomonas flagellata]